VNITKDLGNIKDGEVPQFFSHKNQLFPAGASLISEELFLHLKKSFALPSGY